MAITNIGRRAYRELDIKMQISWEILQDLNKKERVTIMIVTHNQKSAEFADKVLERSEGNLN